MIIIIIMATPVVFCLYTEWYICGLGIVRGGGGVGK